MTLKNWVVQIYLWLMLGIFPLYYQNKYFDMGDAKYTFFKTATLGFLAIAVVVWLGNIFVQPNEKKKDLKRVGESFSAQDITVLAYLVLAVISWLISPYRSDAWRGSIEWYMGLFSQLLFCGIYFVISRWGTEKPWHLWIAGGSAVLVFVLSYLHRFKIDPLGFYDGVAEKLWSSFLGTIGNATWYSSYICVVLPVFIGIYLFIEHKKSHIYAVVHKLLLVLIFCGFATLFTQNSDSAYVGMGLAYLFYLWYAMGNPKLWLRFLETLMIGTLAMKITGVLQLTFPEHVVKLTKISFALTKEPATWGLLAFVVILYLITLYLIKKQAVVFGENGSAWKTIRKIRTIIYILIIVAILSIPIIMWLATTGKIAEGTGLIWKTGYFIFDDKWGTLRGQNWKYAVRIFKEFPLEMKLFGCGPDSMCYYSAAFHQAEMTEMWNGVIVTNAHNEWLTALINYGIFGALAYVSIFASAIILAVRGWKKNSLMIIAGASVIAYMGHNFFCYQQVVCTPLIFIVIAMAEYYRRNYMN